MRGYLVKIIVFSAVSGLLSLICHGMKLSKSVDRVLSLILVILCLTPLLSVKLSFPELPDLVFESSVETDNAVVQKAGSKLCFELEKAIKEKFHSDCKCTVYLDCTDRENIGITKIIILTDSRQRSEIERFVREETWCDKVIVRTEERFEK